MAKEKAGIKYFSQDTDHVLNTKVKLLFNEFDAVGIWIWECLKCEIYAKKGYYFDLNDTDELIMFASDVCKKPVSLVKEIIAGCVRRGLFDKSVHDSFNVLTSDRIQSNFLDGNREKRKKGPYVADVFIEFLLIKIGENEKRIDLISVKNPDYREPIEKYRERLNNSREKVDKLNEIKLNEIKGNQTNYACEDFFKNITVFFGFSEISHFPNFKLLSEMCYALENSGKLDYFKIQAQAYIDFKNLKGYPHSFENFIGDQSQCFENGKWNAENWQKKLTDESKKLNGNNNQRSSAKTQRSATTGHTPANGYGKP